MKYQAYCTKCLSDKHELQHTYQQTYAFQIKDRNGTTLDGKPVIELHTNPGGSRKCLDCGEKTQRLFKPEGNPLPLHSK